MTWLYYLLEANLYLTVAYGCYWLLFRRQTFYTANRLYLLLSTVICFVIPLVQLPGLQHNEAAPVQQQMVTVMNYAPQVPPPPPPTEPLLTLNKAITATYGLISLLVFVLFILKLYSLLKLIFRNKRIRQENFTMVYVDQSSTPFSFFGYLFVSPGDDLAETILRHELVHIRQKHSWDIVFTEILKIMNWFNPVVYLLQNSLKALHEFEADRCAAGGQQQQDGYVDFLISQAYHSSGVPFANHFSNKQLLKTRIIMLYQKRSGKLARLNYLLAVPLCAGLLCASTLAFSKDYGFIKLDMGKPVAVEALPQTAGDAKKGKQPKTAYTASKSSVILVKFDKITTLTKRLEVVEADHQTHVYTAKNLTNEDQKRLLSLYKISVSNIYETKTKSSIESGSIAPLVVISTTGKNDKNGFPVMSVSPPPPPMEATVPAKNSLNIPPPPPPSALSKASKIPPPPPPNAQSKASNLPPPPPPPVEPNNGQKELTADEFKRMKLGDTIVTFSFRDLQKHLSRTMRYPTDAQKDNITGSLLTSFTVDKNQEISNVMVKKGTNTNLDAEAVKVLSAYKGKVVAKPGTYTLRLTFKLQYADGTESGGDEKKADQEKATAGETTITAYGTKK